MTENDMFFGEENKTETDPKQILLSILREQDQCIYCNKFIDLTTAVPKEDHVEFWYHCPRCGEKQGMTYNSKIFADRFREVFGNEGYRKKDKVS